MSVAKAEAVLKKAGLGEHLQRLRPLMPFKDGMRLILHIEEGQWDLYGKPKSGPREDIDFNAEYELKKNTVEKIHSTGSTTLRWSVSGTTLMLEWLKTNEPPYMGIPDEAFQRVLYMTENFERQT